MVKEQQTEEPAGVEIVDVSTGEIANAALVPTSDFVGRLVSRLPGGRLQLRHLTRVVTPARGAGWELPTLQGVVSCGKSLAGVVVGAQVNRAYWPHEMGQGNPAPECFSADGRQGFGTPGGACQRCPNAQWGSGQNRSQACKEFRSLLVYPAAAHQILPTVIRISPASIDAWDRYSTMLLSNGLAPEDVVTALDLVAASSKSGIEYSGVAPRMIELLPLDVRSDTSQLFDVLRQAIGFRQLAELVETTSTAAEPLPEEAYAGLGY